MITVFVPYPQLRLYQKVHQRLVRELEKKFSQRYVVFIAARRVLPKPTRKSRVQHKQKRPRSRTLTAVHEAVLSDVVYPAEIVGKRIRYKADGSQVMKVHLDKTQEINLGNKVSSFPAFPLSSASSFSRVGVFKRCFATSEFSEPLKLVTRHSSFFRLSKSN